MTLSNLFDSFFCKNSYRQKSVNYFNYYLDREISRIINDSIALPDCILINSDIDTSRKFLVFWFKFFPNKCCLSLGTWGRSPLSSPSCFEFAWKVPFTIFLRHFNKSILKQWHAENTAKKYWNKRFRSCERPKIFLHPKLDGVGREASKSYLHALKIIHITFR